MQTTRQIDRLWNARAYARLADELLRPRTEYSPRLAAELASSTPAVAALALIRLDELTQPHHPLNAKLIRTILAAQEGDGGWGDPLVTALCLRALLCSRGHGVAVELGLTYLANLQKDSGLWPAEPLRRMPEDPFVSAFILHQLIDHPQFRDAINLDAALTWFATHQPTLDPTTQRLYHRTSLRHHLIPEPVTN